MKCKSHILGFPRIGLNRELKFAMEAFWNKKINNILLKKIAKNIKYKNWYLQKKYYLDYITVGDFAWYDHILNMLALLGCIPTRFKFNPSKLTLNQYYDLARGNKNNHSMEMTKWFNTNYHYLVPEWTDDISFDNGVNWLFEDIEKAIKKKYNIKVVLIGPLTMLYLGKIVKNLNSKLDLLPKILLGYKKIINKLKKYNISLIQIDEPILIYKLNNNWKNAFIKSYNDLYDEKVSFILSTYFGSIYDFKLLKKLSINGIHIDVTNNNQLKKIYKEWPANKILSIGIIDGRNIWKNNLDFSLKKIKPIYKKFKNNLFISSSCSLIHVPIDLNKENKINLKIKNWLSFAIQKIKEIFLLKNALNKKNNKFKKFFLNYRNILKNKKKFFIKNNNFFKKKNKNLLNLNFNRKSNFNIRNIKQKKYLNIPIYPTTTIGSFPQTNKIRQTRLNYKNNKISKNKYFNQIKKEIKFNIKIQEKLNLDILVHGEPERNDMVEYFGENLKGFLITNYGWVQSYGSRCVKPPIIYSNIFREKPIVLYWSIFSQSLTKKYVKSMLTGPITILKWSFLRNDKTYKEIAKQISYVLKEEVRDLEKSGIRIIQIDEPAFKEGLPLKSNKKKDYLNSAINFFKISSFCTYDITQIHTHMCYSKFDKILSWISKMDADVITIETAKSNMKLLNNFKKNNYPNDIGPGIYDIHSVRIPSFKTIFYLIEYSKKFINYNQLWINPDCGLKTRKWVEIYKALFNMVKAAKKQRYLNIKK